MISPPGTRGTTEYRPPRCMFARKRSFVSCSVSCSGSMMSSFHRLARIEATAGLQISQPWPRPQCARIVAERAQLFRLHDREQFGPRVAESARTDD